METVKALFQKSRIEGLLLVCESDVLREILVDWLVGFGFNCQYFTQYQAVCQTEEERKER